MRKCLILLSTYNGERYLKEQLDSLYAQERVEMHILVRDDGSKDGTLDILEDYQYQYGKMTIIKGHNIGVGPSFYALINEAVTKYLEYDYYAFCDQDDVWFKDKIAKGIDRLEGIKNQYKLYYSSAISTDSQLIPIPSKGIGIVNTFGANLVANHILGCCMLFNKNLLFEINSINSIPYKIPDGIVPIHDGWAATVAFALNADVVYDKTSLMYYRQHGNNEIGAGKSFLSVQVKRIRRYIKKSTHVKSNRCIIALQVLGEKIPTKNMELMKLVENYRNNFSAKLRLLFDKRMYEYDIVDNVGTVLMVLLNKF